MDPLMMGYPVVAPQRHRAASHGGQSSHSRTTSQASTLAGSQAADPKSAGDHEATIAPVMEGKGETEDAETETDMHGNTVSREDSYPFLRLPLRDNLKTLLLLALSLLAAPLSYAVALALTALPPSWVSWLIPFSPTTPASAAAHRAACRADPGFRERTVLVTGVGMAKGLALARAFWLCGHRVVAADFDAERCGAWTPWRGRRLRPGADTTTTTTSSSSSSSVWAGMGVAPREHAWSFSRAFDAVYTLQRPAVFAGDDGDGDSDGDSDSVARDAERREAQRTYVRDIAKIMLDEDVDLWVSCSGVASAVEDAMAQEAIEASSGTGAGAGALGRQAKPRSCIQFDVPTTEMLHEKSSFIRHAKKLDLPVPETHDVFSHSDVLQALTKAMRRNPQRRFILKPVGMDDVHRGDMTLLPLATHWDTEAHVQQRPISRARPWILQQFVQGGREYCTHALVVDGEVKAFVACPSSELLMHYAALPPGDPLGREMLAFTQRFADAERRAGRPLTGHLSFDFMAEADERAGKTSLYAIECNPRAHTAVTLFATPGPEMRAMVEAYLSATRTGAGTHASAHHPAGRRPKHAPRHGLPLGVVRPPPDASSRYWVGHDLFASLLLPLWSLIRGETSRAEFSDLMVELRTHLLSWQDGTFELWDPWPFVALYHHYWPRAIFDAWWKGGRWSRLNVSTTKMFAC